MEPPNLYEFSSGVPLTEDVWLGMQLRNILIVDECILRPIERDALQEYIARDKTPGEILMVLNAASQMWVYSLYEFLRTWRQRAGELLDISKSLNGLSSDDAKLALDAAAQKFATRETLIRIAPSWYSTLSSSISDNAYMTRVSSYLEAIEGVFRDAESLRVTLAKHEIPKTKGMIAEAPGYARMSYEDGSLYWFFTEKDGSQGRVVRRELADAFYSISV